MSLDLYFEQEKDVRDFEISLKFVDNTGHDQTFYFPTFEDLRRFVDSETHITITLAQETITHNLTEMAEALGVYDILWHSGGLKAYDILFKINTAISELTFNRKQYEIYESPNGWGTVNGMLSFLKRVKEDCEEYPDAKLLSSI